MIFIGGDPDLHNSAMAMVNEGGSVEAVQVIRTKSKTKGRDAAVAMTQEISKKLHVPVNERYQFWVAIEGQHYRPNGNVRAGDLILLGMVSGAMLTGYGQSKNCVRAMCPQPVSWKGSVPKVIHQKRICEQVGWPSTGTKTYIFPHDRVRKAYGYPNKAAWKHIMDAIGLALWARDEWLKEQDRGV